MGLQRKIRNFIQTPCATFRRVCLYIVNSRRYKEYHLSCIVRSPLFVTPSCVTLRPNVCIGKHARIEGVFAYNGKRFSPVIEFGESCTVEQGLHLTCANRVSIGQNTVWQLAHQRESSNSITPRQTNGKEYEWEEASAIRRSCLYGYI